MAVARGKKEDCEVSEGRVLLADSLHNKGASVHVILEKGGDYLIGLKENSSQCLAGATQAPRGTPSLS
jgi:hypothetical protein